MKELLLRIVRALVDEPDEVAVAEIDGRQALVLELRVGRGDLGKVIGKQGRTARSIRTLLSAAGTRAGKRVVLEIVE